MQGVGKGDKYISVESRVVMSSFHGTVLGLGQGGRYQQIGRPYEHIIAVRLLLERVVVRVGREHVKETQVNLSGPRQIHPQ